MTLPEDVTLDIEESVQRDQEKCRGNRLHNGPFTWCMWRFVAYYTRKSVKDRKETVPHYRHTEGLLCEKCILEFCALRVPNKGL